jgi:hypothetical protein
VKHKRKNDGHKLLPVLFEAIDDDDCMPDKIKESERKICYY